MKNNVFTVERLISAPPEAIFAILADPAKHALIDGSGMLQGASEAASERLALGVTFGMGMKMGVRYSTVNTVVEFEENRRIAWQTGPKGKLEPYVAGRIWRYELEPRGERTLVRESWDITNGCSCGWVTSTRRRPDATWSSPWPAWTRWSPPPDAPSRRRRVGERASCRSMVSRPGRVPLHSASTNASTVPRRPGTRSRPPRRQVEATGPAAPRTQGEDGNPSGKTVAQGPASLGRTKDDGESTVHVACAASWSSASR